MVSIGGKGKDVHAVTFEHVVHSDGEGVGDLTNIEHAKPVGFWARGVRVGNVDCPTRTVRTWDMSPLAMKGETSVNETYHPTFPKQLTATVKF